MPHITQISAELIAFFLSINHEETTEGQMSGECHGCVTLQAAPDVGPFLLPPSNALVMQSNHNSFFS